MLNVLREGTEQNLATTKFCELLRLELKRRRLSRELAEIQYQHLMLRLEIESLGLEMPWRAPGHNKIAEGKTVPRSRRRGQ